MLKKIIFAGLLVLSQVLCAQVYNTKNLSPFTFLDSETILEENGEDVYGYLFLYEKDRINEMVHELEYVLLDKNLNRVTSDYFKQVRFNVFGVRNSTGIYYSKKVGNKLYLSIGEGFPQSDNITSELGIISMQTLDLATFRLSDPVIIKDYKYSGAKPMDELSGNCFMTPTKNNGFIVYDEAATTAYRRNISTEMRSLKQLEKFTFFDLDFKEKWSFSYNPDHTEASFDVYRYLTGDGNDMIFKKFTFTNGLDKHPKLEYDVIDAQEGTKKFELKLHKDQFLLDVVDIKFESDKMVVFAALNEFNPDKIFQQNRITGYIKLILDRKDGKELSADYFIWSALSDKYKIDKYGKIQDYGFIHFHDFTRLSNGNTIVVGEGFVSGGKTLVLDLFLFVFDPEMNIVDFAKIDKFKNTLYFQNTYGKKIAKSGAFDFLFKQRIEKDNYVFFYRDNEKAIDESLLNSKWILGITKFVDGNFDYDKIALTAKDKKIFPYKAKNGYVLLREINENGTELRLEKINY